jgi:hypothetical protein
LNGVQPKWAFIQYCRPGIGFGSPKFHHSRWQSIAYY